MEEAGGNWQEVRSKKKKKNWAEVAATAPAAKAKGKGKAAPQPAQPKPKVQWPRTKSSGAAADPPAATTASGISNSGAADPPAATTESGQPVATDLSAPQVSSPGPAQQFTPTAATDRGFVTCPRCGMVLKGGAAALRQHQATSSRCLATAGEEGPGSGRTPCPHGCGKMIAFGDAWALTQHESFCVAFNRQQRERERFSYPASREDRWPHSSQSWSSSWSWDSHQSQRPSYWHDESQRWGSGYWVWCRYTDNPWSQSKSWSGDY